MKWKQRGQVGAGVANIVCRRTWCVVFVFFLEEREGGGILRGYAMVGALELPCRHQRKKRRGRGGVVWLRREKRGVQVLKHCNNKRQPGKQKPFHVRTCASLVIAPQEECSGRGGGGKPRAQIVFLHRETVLET